MIQADADTRIRGFLKALIEKVDESEDSDECTCYTDASDGCGEL